ncbi:hypothetical protein [Falsirhodobacter sp. 20TX0035]|nr:hypothetical protein [Falsirhodobacter sp. 20TX0035]MDB6453772.1 hypothetical protein [Falsirhodobacter sp. 20TX0035]
MAHSNPNYFLADVSADKFSGNYKPAEGRELLASNGKGNRPSG